MGCVVKRLWLVVLFLLVTAMIVVGGLTRLTDSGPQRPAQARG